MRLREGSCDDFRSLAKGGRFRYSVELDLGLLDDSGKAGWMMAVNVAAGSVVQVRIARVPRRAAAVKTLDKLFRKDAAHRKELARLKKSRPVRMDRRGGRLWGDRPAQLRPYKIERGATCRIVASLDVLKDLASLGDAVEVKAVK